MFYTAYLNGYKFKYICFVFAKIDAIAGFSSDNYHIQRLDTARILGISW